MILQDDILELVVQFYKEYIKNIGQNVVVDYTINPDIYSPNFSKFSYDEDFISEGDLIHFNLRSIKPDLDYGNKIYFRGYFYIVVFEDFHIEHKDHKDKNDILRFNNDFIEWLKKNNHTEVASKVNRYVSKNLFL